MLKHIRPLALPAAALAALLAASHLGGPASRLITLAVAIAALAAAARKVLSR